MPSDPSTAGSSPDGGDVPGFADEAFLRGAGADRRGGDTAQTDPRGGHDALANVERKGDRDARDVVEAALRDLVERGHLGKRQGDADRTDQLIAAPHALAVAGEVLGEIDLSLTVERRQHDSRAEGEESGRDVPDRRRGAQVSADRGAVSDEGRRELREQLVQQRYSAPETTLDLRQVQRRTDLDRLVGDREAAQLGELVDRDRDLCAAAAQVGVDAPVGGAGHDDRPGLVVAAAVSASPSVAGRTKRLPSTSTSAGTGGGAGRLRRAASGSSGCGIPSAYAASRIGR